MTINDKDVIRFSLPKLDSNKDSGCAYTFRSFNIGEESERDITLKAMEWG